MNTATIIRAWKDPEFRAHLTSEQRQALPESPSGKSMSDLVDEDLADVMGGGTPPSVITPLLITRRGNACVTYGSAFDNCPAPCAAHSP